MEQYVREEAVMLTKRFCIKMAELLLAGKNLFEISQWSFDQRQMNPGSPYMGVLEKHAKGMYTAIYCKPTTKQFLYELFNEKIEDTVHTRYVLTVDLINGIRFIERASVMDTEPVVHFSMRIK